MTNLSNYTDDIVSERSKFDDFVYLSLPDAVKELEKRRKNQDLIAYINKVLPDGIPPIMKAGKNAVIFRHVATTNFEIARFLVISRTLEGFKPIILEYTEDKFLSRNEWKHSLGNLRFEKGINKNGRHIDETKVIIDFSNCDNKPISSIRTLWGENLVDFHHQLFFSTNPEQRDGVFDVSNWLKGVGIGARAYYKQFLTLFLVNGILFENFMIEKREKDFTKEIVIPAIQKIFNECGYKPIIVALEPTEAEGDVFWLSHPYSDKVILDAKFNNGGVEKAKNL